MMCIHCGRDEAADCESLDARGDRALRPAEASLIFRQRWNRRRSWHRLPSWRRHRSAGPPCPRSPVAPRVLAPAVRRAPLHGVGLAGIDQALLALYSSHQGTHARCVSGDAVQVTPEGIRQGQVTDRAVEASLVGHRRFTVPEQRAQPRELLWAQGRRPRDLLQHRTWAAEPAGAPRGATPGTVRSGRAASGRSRHRGGC